MAKLKLKNLEIANNVWMAPLCGVTDLPFRGLVKEQGAGLVHTEMVSSAALARDSKKTFRYMELSGLEHPVSIQLFGCDPAEMGEAARLVDAWGADAIGINFGCPVPKVVNHNGGSALLKEPATVFKVVREVARATDKPVLPKIRLGWDENSVNAVEIGRLVEQAGAAALMIHGRTRSQRFSGRANWDAIAEVKRAVSIPVIGNGDLTRPEEVAEALRNHGVDGVLLARGAMGNPWLFSRSLRLLETGDAGPETPDEDRVLGFLRHAGLAHGYRGAQGLVELRKLAPAYLKGLPRSAELRQNLNQTSDFARVDGLLRDYLRDLPRFREECRPRAVQEGAAREDVPDCALACS